MENNKINVLFVCGMGMGTSTMAEIGVKKALGDYNISANLQHTSLGMMESLHDWSDIIVILKNLAKKMKTREGDHVITVVNIMDSKSIAAQINDIVEEYFPAAKGGNE